MRKDCIFSDGIKDIVEKRKQEEEEDEQLLDSIKENNLYTKTEESGINGEGSTCLEGPTAFE